MFRQTLSIIITLLICDNVGGSKWWNGWSPNDNNDRYQREKLPVTLPTEKTEFQQLWYTKLDGPVETSPTIYENYVYVSTFSGSFYCLQANSGIIVWQKNLTSVLNNGHLYGTRTSALIYNKMIILGLSDGSLIQAVPGYGSYAVALNLFTGAVVWQRKVSSHPVSVITGTPQLVNDRMYIGISSNEEAFATNPAYPCCTFQGSVVALKASTGQFLWERKMIPDNNGTTTGYSGAAVLG